MMETAIINGKSNFIDLGKTGVLTEFLLKTSNRMALCKGIWFFFYYNKLWIIYKNKLIKIIFQTIFYNP